MNQKKTATMAVFSDLGTDYSYLEPLSYYALLTRLRYGWGGDGLGWRLNAGYGVFLEFVE